MHPSLMKLLLISVAFEIYHALKIGLRSEVDYAQEHKRFAQIYRVACKVARNFLLTHSTGKYIAVWAAHPGENLERESYNRIQVVHGSQVGLDDPNAQGICRCLSENVLWGQLTQTQHHDGDGPVCFDVADDEDSLGESIVSDDWDLLSQASAC